MNESSSETERLNMRIQELEHEVARLVLDLEIREVEIAALRADLELKTDYLSTLEKIPEEVVAPKDVHIRNLEAIIVQLNDALAARKGQNRFFRRAAGKLRRTIARRGT